MKKIQTLTLIAYGVLLTTAHAEQLKYNPQNDAFNDYRIALIEAKERKVNVFIDVGGDWCGDCRRLDIFFTSNPTLYNFIRKNYVILKVYVGDERDNSAFFQNFPEFNWVPYFFILDEKGRVIAQKDTRDVIVNKSFNKIKVQEFFASWTRKK